MSGWTKLFSSIVTSSVWCEDHATVRVWIALLALADAHGRVEGSVPGLANLCRVTDDQMRAALAKFCGPDPDSRTPDHEGRRLAPIPGGWQILNYAVYRERAQEKQGSRAPYMRDYRKKHDGGGAVTRNKPVLRVTQKREERNGSSRASSRVAPWSTQAVDDWAARFDGGTAPGGQIGKALAPLVKAHGWETVRPAWQRYLAATEARFASAPRFAATFGDWRPAPTPNVKPEPEPTGPQFFGRRKERV